MTTFWLMWMFFAVLYVCYYLERISSILEKDRRDRDAEEEERRHPPFVFDPSIPPPPMPKWMADLAEEQVKKR